MAVAAWDNVIRAWWQASSTPQRAHALEQQSEASESAARLRGCAGYVARQVWVRFMPLRLERDAVPRSSSRLPERCWHTQSAWPLPWLAQGSQRATPPPAKRLKRVTPLQ
eukprot:4745368-Amphidinium_carterae.3